MHDDRFDRDLAARLRAYESRVPDAPAPDPRAGRRRRGSGWPVLAAGGAALAVAGALAVAVILDAVPRNVGDTSPRPSGTVRSSAAAAQTDSASPTGSATPSGSATASPSPSPMPPPTVPPTGSSDLAWAQTAAFGTSGGAAVVHDVVAAQGGLVAVGVQYDRPLPNVGPIPRHQARVWISGDGDSWQDVTPAHTFENVSLEQVVVLTDGSLLARGVTTVEDEAGQWPAGSGLWASSDGRAWQATSTAFPEGSGIWHIAHGGRGYLAHITAPGATHGSELWFSPDGRAWERVRELTDGSVTIGAGAEGFVVAGMLAYYGDPQQPFASASADGRNWIDSAAPPADVVALAPLDGDWIAASYGFGQDSPDDRVSISFSPNGLDWNDHGELALDRLTVEGGSCVEVPAELNPGGRWLVIGTILSHPCGEGGFVVHGTQSISVDGSTWTSLPFETGTPGASGSGAGIRAAVEVDGRLVLAGEVNHQAVFWLGESR